eukprot:PhM_4_TR16238/c0_g1_i1/m.98605
MSKKPPKDDASTPATTKITANIPCYPRWNADAPRQSWEADYDRIEGELMKSYIPNSGTASLCARRPMEAMNSIPLPGDEQNQQQQQHIRPRTGAAAAPRSASTTVMPRLARPSSTATNTKTTTTATTTTKTSLPPRRTRPTTAATTLSTTANNTNSPARSARSSLFPERNALANVSIRDISALYSVVCPPVELMGAVNLSTKHMDLSWLKDQRQLMGITSGSALTLETLRDDLFTNPSLQEKRSHGGTREVTLLNSPRSILVCLRNGVCVEDLQRRDRAHFQGLGDARDIVNLRYEHYEQRRADLMNELRDQYREIRGMLGWSEIVGFLQAHVSAGAASNPNTSTTALDTETGVDTSIASNSSAYRQRKEKQRMTIEYNRKRLEKQIEYHEELVKAQEAAEEKRRQVEEEQRVAKEKKRQEASARREQAEVKMKELREHTAELTAQFNAKMHDKMKIMEARDQVHRTQIEEKRRQKKLELEASRQEAVQRKQETNMRLQRVLEERRTTFEEKERLAAERKAVKDAEKESHRVEAALRNERVEKARQEAAQRAQEREEATRRRALELQQSVDERLRSFSESREQERERRRHEEMSKTQHRHDVVRTGREMLQHKREEALDRFDKVERAVSEQREKQRQAKRQEAELERLVTEDKAFFLARQARAKEFHKALIVDGVRRKKEQHEAQEEMKNMLLKETFQSRLELAKERDTMLQKLAQTAAGKA